MARFYVPLCLVALFAGALAAPSKASSSLSVWSHGDKHGVDVVVKGKVHTSGDATAVVSGDGEAGNYDSIAKAGQEIIGSSYDHGRSYGEGHVGASHQKYKGSHVHSHLKGDAVNDAHVKGDNYGVAAGKHGYSEGETSLDLEAHRRGKARGHAGGQTYGDRKGVQSHLDGKVKTHGPANGGAGGKKGSVGGEYGEISDVVKGYVYSESGKKGKKGY